MPTVVEAPNAHKFKNQYFPVLNDDCFVALIDFMGGDADVLQAARISYGAGTKPTSGDRGLLRYMLSHRHSSPFEQVVLKFHVKLPIFVARQLVRHRTASLNEYSLRYSLAPMQFYIPEFDNFQKQSKSNRQGRSDQADRAVYDRVRYAWIKLQNDASGLYQSEILEDIARELARIHLPVSLLTEWYWTIDLHNLMHFLGLRSDSHAQWEIRQFSNVKAGLAQAVAPMSMEAWMDYRHCATTLSRMEWNVLRKLVRRCAGSESDRSLATVDDVFEERRAGMLKYIDESNMVDYGLGKREIDELLAKFEGTNDVPVPDYTLNLADAKPASYFYERAQAAVPEALRGK